MPRRCVTRSNTTSCSILAKSPSPTNCWPVARDLANLLAKGERIDAGKKDESRAVRVHAYVSKIDGSLQPYRIIVPPGFDAASERPHRLDFWCHGRGETLSELNFISQTSWGEFTPPDAFVVHLYGRYCNANKLAGEIDLLEALTDVKRRYPIDDDRIVVRGFSMGGAACWQFAVHYPGLFAAAAPVPAFPRRVSSSGYFKTKRSTRLGTSRSCGTSTIAPITR